MLKRPFGRNGLLVPVLGVVAWLQLGCGWELVTVLWLIPVGLAVAVIDLQTLMVPTRLVWPAFAVEAAVIAAASIERGQARLLIGAGAGAAPPARSGRPTSSAG